MNNDPSLYVRAEPDRLGGLGASWQPVGSERRPILRARRHDGVKRTADFLGAALLILFFLPFFLLIALILWFSDSGPIFFSHERIGRGGVTFGCLKFRTMYRDADLILAEKLRNDPDARREWEENQKLRNDPRVHPVGKFLRRSSLDELPQLFNVLAGSMSLVGPRPIVGKEVAHYGNRIGCYLSLRPGITGLWQVSGRNDTTYSERVSLDERYFHEQSFLLDARILVRTLWVVLLAKGAY